MNSSIATHLPLEILQIIFDILFLDSERYLTRRENRRSRYGHSSFIWTGSSDDLMASFNHFDPSELSLVCRAWRLGLLGMAKFWTRIIICVNGSFSTPLSILEMFQERSRNELVDLVVVAPAMSEEEANIKDGDIQLVAADGKARVRAILELLKAHIHSLRTLDFDLKYSTSLPSLTQDFPTTAPNLERFALHSQCRVITSPFCAEEWVPRRDFIGPVEYPGQLSPFPQLRDLVLDTANFAHACIDSMPQSWMRSLQYCRSLVIENYSNVITTLPYCRQSFGGFSMYDLLRSLPSGISSLELACVNLDSVSEEDSDSGLEPENHIHYLSLKNIYDIGWVPLRRLEVHQLSVQNCFGFLSLLPLAPLTIFADITEDDNAEFQDFLSHWSGCNLTVINCPGFNDDILKSWSGHGSDSNEISCTMLTTLVIRDCPNFSADALMRVMRTHFEQSDGDNNLMIENLHISGEGPALSEPMDILWLFMNVCELHWHTTEPDGMVSSYAWNHGCRNSKSLQLRNELFSSMEEYGISDTIMLSEILGRALSI